MIQSAEEFVRLRTSKVAEEYYRAAHEEAHADVWKDVIAKYPEMREWVAHNKSIPEEIIRILAKDEDQKVRYTIAVKGKTPADVQKVLAEDEEASIRCGVACNKKAPHGLLKTLSTDPSSLVRANVVANKKTPREILLAMLDAEYSVIVLRSLERKLGLSHSSKRIFLTPTPYKRERALKELDSGDCPRVCKAMISMASFETDWRLAQNKFLELLETVDEDIRGLAGACLGHLARIHGRIDHEKVLPALRGHSKWGLVSDYMVDALEAIHVYAPMEGRR